MEYGIGKKITRESARGRISLGLKAKVLLRWATAGEKFDNLGAPELYAAQFSHKILVDSDGMPSMENNVPDGPTCLSWFCMPRSELPGETL